MAQTQERDFFRVDQEFPLLLLPANERNKSAGDHSSQAISDARNELEGALQSIFKRLVVPVINEAGQLENVPYFSYLQARIDSKVKIVPSGGVVRSAISYVYAQLYEAWQRNPDVDTARVLEQISRSSDPVLGYKIRGAGSDFDVLVSGPSDRLPEAISKINSITNSAETKYDARNMKGDEKRTLFVVGDVKPYDEQITLSTRQGGSTVDFLAFDIENGKFIEPKTHPYVVNELIAGVYRYLAPAQNEKQRDPDKQTVRGIRPLLELPFLRLIDDSVFRKEIGAIITEMKKGKPLSDKALSQFDKIVRNSRFSGAHNRIYRGGPGTVEALLLDFNEALKTSARRHVIPEFVDSFPIELRDPLKKAELRGLPRELLVSQNEFIKTWTDGGYVYHGTPTLSNSMAILRGGLFVSGGRNQQGGSVFGTGGYSSNNYQTAQSYAGQGGVVFRLRIKTDPRVNTLKRDAIDSSHPWILAARAQAKKFGMDFNQYLARFHGIDFVLNNHVLILNANAVDIGNDLEALIRALHSRTRSSSQNIAETVESYFEFRKLIPYAQALGLTNLPELEPIASLVTRLRAEIVTPDDFRKAVLKTLVRWKVQSPSLYGKILAQNNFTKIANLSKDDAVKLIESVRSMDRQAIGSHMKELEDLLRLHKQSTSAQRALDMVAKYDLESLLILAPDQPLSGQGPRINEMWKHIRDQNPTDLDRALLRHLIRTGSLDVSNLIEMKLDGAAQRVVIEALESEKVSARKNLGEYYSGLHLEVGADFSHRWLKAQEKALALVPYAQDLGISVGGGFPQGYLQRLEQETSEFLRATSNWEARARQLTLRLRKVNPVLFDSLKARFVGPFDIERTHYSNIFSLLDQAPNVDRGTGQPDLDREIREVVAQYQKRFHILWVLRELAQINIDRFIMVFPEVEISLGETKQSVRSRLSAMRLNVSRGRPGPGDVELLSYLIRTRNTDGLASLVSGLDKGAILIVMQATKSAGESGIDFFGSILGQVFAEGDRNNKLLSDIIKEVLSRDLSWRDSVLKRLFHNLQSAEMTEGNSGTDARSKALRGFPWDLRQQTDVQMLKMLKRPGANSNIQMLGEQIVNDIEKRQPDLAKQINLGNRTSQQPSDEFKLRFRETYSELYRLSKGKSKPSEASLRTIRETLQLPINPSTADFFESLSYPEFSRKLVAKRIAELRPVDDLNEVARFYRDDWPMAARLKIRSFIESRVRANDIRKNFAQFHFDVGSDRKLLLSIQALYDGELQERARKSLLRLAEIDFEIYRKIAQDIPVAEVGQHNPIAILAKFKNLALSSGDMKFDREVDLLLRYDERNQAIERVLNLTARRNIDAFIKAFPNWKIQFPEVLSEYSDLTSRVLPEPAENRVFQMWTHVGQGMPQAGDAELFAAAIRHNSRDLLFALKQSDQRGRKFILESLKQSDQKGAEILFQIVTAFSDGGELASKKMDGKDVLAAVKESLGRDLKWRTSVLKSAIEGNLAKDPTRAGRLLLFPWDLKKQPDVDSLKRLLALFPNVASEQGKALRSVFSDLMGKQADLMGKYFPELRARLSAEVSNDLLRRFEPLKRKLSDRNYKPTATESQTLREFLRLPIHDARSNGDLLQLMLESKLTHAMAKRRLLAPGPSDNLATILSYNSIKRSDFVSMSKERRENWKKLIEARIKHGDLADGFEKFPFDMKLDLALLQSIERLEPSMGAGHKLQISRQDLKERILQKAAESDVDLFIRHFPKMRLRFVPTVTDERGAFAVEDRPFERRLFQMWQRVRQGETQPGDIELLRLVIRSIGWNTNNDLFLALKLSNARGRELLIEAFRTLGEAGTGPLLNLLSGTYQPHPREVLSAVKEPLATDLKWRSLVLTQITAVGGREVQGIYLFPWDTKKSVDVETLRRLQKVSYDSKRHEKLREEANERFQLELSGYTSSDLRLVEDPSLRQELMAMEDRRDLVMLLPDILKKTGPLPVVADRAGEKPGPPRSNSPATPAQGKRCGSVHLQSLSKILRH